MSEEPLIEEPHGWDDFRIEIIVGNLLRSGVILAASVVLVGGAVYLARHGQETPNYFAFHGEPKSLKSPGAIFEGVLQLSGSAIIQFGLLLLIATPVARVLFSAVAFAIEHDGMYVVVTLIVLVVLLLSLFGFI